MSRVIRSGSATHPGAVRTENQDACLCRPEIGLFAVADGVGGRADGAVAAGRVVAMLNTIPDSLPPDALLAAVRDRLRQTHEDLLGASGSSGLHAAPATTIVVLLLHQDHFACLWAGDSRAYLLRDGQICRLTTDHSVVQDLINAGTLTEAEAEDDPRQNVITRAVGAGENGRSSKSGSDGSSPMIASCCAATGSTRHSTLGRSRACCNWRLMTRPNDWSKRQCAAPHGTM